MKSFLVSLIALLIVSCSHKLTSSSQLNTRELDHSIREIILSQGDSMFNGSILILSHGKEIVKQNYGMVDSENTADINDNSRFNVGSMSKEFPAIAILDLILKGKISYEKTLDEYLDRLPKWAETVTIKDLLFYTSGLPPFDFHKCDSDQRALMELPNIEELLFLPGEGYLYSNWNNFLQALIIESVTGQKFRSFIKNEYFDPLSIKESFYDYSIPVESKNMTRSYSEIWGDDQDNYPRFNHFELCYGPLYMTSSDLAKWIEYVRGRYDPYIEDVATFFQETNIKSLGPLGIVEYDKGKLVTHRHGGFAYSAGTVTYRHYSNGISIILMTNRNRGNELGELLDEILELL